MGITIMDVVVEIAEITIVYALLFCMVLSCPWS